jgi:ATP-dependent DNA ligase
MPECLVAIAFEIFNVRKDFRRISQERLQLMLALNVGLLPHVTSVEIEQVESQIDDAIRLYEIKADGYRAQVHVKDKNVIVYSRSGYNWTDRFSTIAEAAKRLRARQAILDGEAIVMGANGVPDFQALRRASGSDRRNR